MKGFVFIVLISTQITYIFASDSKLENGCFIWDSQCMTKFAQAVAPSAIQRITDNGVQVDPLSIDYIKMHELGLILDKKDVKMYGLKNLEVKHFSIDPTVNMTRFVFNADIYSTGHYKSSGSMFNSPVFGESDYRITINNIEIEVYLQYIINKGFAEITSHLFRYDIKDGATYFYENLYNGNKDYSDDFHLNLNKNWKLVADLYGKNFVGAIVDGMVKAVGHCLQNVPVADLCKF